jgi:hypothetical protein
MLWHRDVGPLLAGSMAEYSTSAEKNNMQPLVGAVDYPLTPRIEAWENGTWFTHLHDLKAEVTPADEKGTIHFKIATRLLSANQTTPAAGPVMCELSYQFAESAMILRAKTDHAHPETLKLALALPVISASGEKVRRVSDKKIEIEKPEGTVVVEANVPLRIQETGRDRIFNLVPGFEAVPIVVDFVPGQLFELECRISINPQGTKGLTQ